MSGEVAVWDPTTGVRAPSTASAVPLWRRRLRACFLCKKPIVTKHAKPGDIHNGEAVHFHVPCWERYRSGEEPRS